MERFEGASGHRENRRIKQSFRKKEALNKSVPDFSALATGKRGFPVAHKINGLQPLILTVHPYTGEPPNKSAVP
jgi:hypothetical protein